MKVGDMVVRRFLSKYHWGMKGIVLAIKNDEDNHFVPRQYKVAWFRDNLIGSNKYGRGSSRYWERHEIEEYNKAKQLEMESGECRVSK